MCPAVVTEYVFAKVWKDGVDREVFDVFESEQAEIEMLEVTWRKDLDIFDLVFWQILQEDTLSPIQSLWGHY